MAMKRLMSRGVGDSHVDDKLSICIRQFFFFGFLKTPDDGRG